VDDRARAAVLLALAMGVQLVGGDAKRIRIARHWPAVAVMQFDHFADRTTALSDLAPFERYGGNARHQLLLNAGDRRQAKVRPSSAIVREITDRTEVSTYFASLNATGKVRFNPRSATNGGGLGTGSACRTIFRAASSYALRPEPSATLTERT
jgi:hypothetical protein